MLHCYEITYRDGGDFPVTRSFDELGDALDFADAHGIDYIAEIGGTWDDLEKCQFCGEWFCSTDLNKDGLCDRCQYAIDTH